MKTLIIDNYDSFTYNLFHLVAEITQNEPFVIKNDELSVNDILKLAFDNIIISPGPGHPNNYQDFGVCSQLIQQYDGPILGICLGHQGIVSAFGGTVSHAPYPMHGQLSTIIHTDDTIFAGIPHEFTAVRYHSLVAQQPLPNCLTPIAQTKDGLIMAVKHKNRPIWGVQYHPESISSQFGRELLANFVKFREYAYAVHVEKIDSIPDETMTAHFLNKARFVWLDSSMISEDSSRFSILGSLDGPLGYHATYDMRSKTINKSCKNNTITLQQSIFEFLKEEIKQFAIKPLNVPFNFQCGFIGYFSYELYQETLNITAKHPSSYPEAQFLFLDRALIIDHQEQCCFLLALHEKGAVSDIKPWINNLKIACKLQPMATSSKPPKPQLKFNHANYLKKIQECQQFIRNGESYEICLTNRLTYKQKIPPQALYQQLRTNNPTPYAAFMQFENMHIICSSMERFLKLDHSGRIESKPIKGTIARGNNVSEDEHLKQLLATDPKFRSENLMIVDLLRNDLGKICKIGSVHVPKLMAVESYAHVHQLVSTVCGTIKPEYDAIDCIKATFPGGSMTGAPKIRTVEILQALEEDARNIYSGSLGYISISGAMDLNIIIRTAIIDEKSTSIGIGGAITALSKPEEEFAEILLKTKPLSQAIAEIFKRSNNLLESIF